MTALNYQFSIFGSYSIQPTAEIIPELMSEINKKLSKSFIPTVIDIPNVDLKNQSVNIITNLQLITLDRRFSIVLLNDRIDINYNKVSDDELEQNEFFHMAEQALHLIMDRFDLSSNRLAINIHKAIMPLSPAELDSFGKESLKCGPYYNDKLFNEWSTRVNSQTDIAMQDMHEEINVITSLSNASVHNQNAVVCHIDINTLPQNMDMRFKKDILTSFINVTMPIAQDIMKGIKGLIPHG